MNDALYYKRSGKAPAAGVFAMFAAGLAAAGLGALAYVQLIELIPLVYFNVLITLGYAITAHTNVLVQAWDFVWDYPGMLLATAGTALLILVVADLALLPGQKAFNRYGASPKGSPKRTPKDQSGASPS